MVKTIKYLLLLVAAIMLSAEAEAQSIVRKKDLVPIDSVEQVVVDGDTVSRIIPQRNLGRFDRGLSNYMFIPRGKWGFGITASYGELKTEDIQLLSILNNFDFKGKMYSIRPSISYFIAHNQSVGLKFNYSRGVADLANLGFEFGDDLSFSIRDVSYYQQSMGISAMYRNYVGLDTHGRFGIFNEVDLAFSSGSSTFKRIYNEEPRNTHTITTQGALNFSPGVCVFIQDYVSFNVSFGVFGLNWKKEQQKTNGIDDGTRVTSGANFRFNIFNINFGLMVVI
ncbi:MAG: hypothetical protein J1F05_08020 [Muribaculaceae bacterium]|nr:hypothetical protein [Muribaculaceae bacterium]